jgi:hypothetical protein
MVCETSKGATEGGDDTITTDFSALRSWIETKHKGFKCKLVSREIPGESSYIWQL